MRNLTGKIALITGGSRGIGKAIALAYAKEGMSVALNYLKDQNSADKTVEEIQAKGGKALALQSDVRVAADIKSMVARTREVFGQIDILVNNAGIATPIPWQQLTHEDWDRVISANLTSAFLTTQEVAPEMVARGWGRIIFLSSVAAQIGGVVGPHYAASKAGLFGLTHGYASVLIKNGVTANAITPALIETDMVTENPNAKEELIPMGRFGTVDEVADLAVLLAHNGFITGQTLNVNGGFYMS